LGVADIWKDKCKKLVEICKSFKQENERLISMEQKSYSATNSQHLDEGNEYSISSEENREITRFKNKRAVEAYQ
jgi:hypothetical protein